jgi:V/A-type H+-transporting ATPase subunit D
MAKYSPTRMELLRLRKRIDLARRGHKLLEDKLEGLIKEFMPLVNEYVALRSDLDARLPKMLRLFQQTAVLAGQDVLRSSLVQTGLRLHVELTEERRANVPVPALKPASNPAPLSTASSALLKPSTSLSLVSKKHCRKS